MYIGVEILRGNETEGYEQGLVIKFVVMFIDDD